MLVTDFDFALPPEQIADAPLAERDAARLYVVDRKGADAERQVRNLPELLPSGALVVVNDTRVLPARLRGQKPSGGRFELLLVEPAAAPSAAARSTTAAERTVWRCLGRASKPFRPGPITLDGDGAPAAEILGADGEFVTVAFAGDQASLESALERIGEVPLPPYIARPTQQAADRTRYQTMFARAAGAVAAPTAGLHFSPSLIAALAARDIRVAPITLHVGPGTFAPLRHERVEDNTLHAERYELSETTAAAIADARRAGRPVVAVGTTVVRTLESCANADGTVTPGGGTTQIFIRPGYTFRAVDHLLTNFHLPRSSLIMLVAAFAGTERTLAAYRAAVAAGFRFYSYGDAMLIR